VTLALELYVALLGGLMLAWVLRPRRAGRSLTARRRTYREEMDRKIRMMLRRRRS